MPSFEARFICARFYEFKDEDGNMHRGYIPYVLSDKDEIIKCKSTSGGFADLTMGDVVNVAIIIHGNYVKYEIL